MEASETLQRAETIHEDLWDVSWRPMRRLMEVLGRFMKTSGTPLRCLMEAYKTPHGGFKETSWRPMRRLMVASETHHGGL
ncbi:unnamed protein product [Nesidiocoris tenuis]|uniref:Uncharacterized protein n=1 Tax=Nesidiocoris tenuis TaxID=355587 RepID=A0A6H5HNX4_9HEMI|nr:unnamed protein product [Nesidiocoris tenuis]